MRANGRDGRLTLEQSAMVTRARTMGLATALPIYLEELRTLQARCDCRGGRWPGP